MTTLTCPKCRQGMTEEALDTEQCPRCGFPIDGPVVLATGQSATSPRWGLIATLTLLVGAAVGMGYAFLTTSRSETNQPTEVATILPENIPNVTVRHIAPFPHEPKRPDSGTNQANPPIDPSGIGNPVPPIPPMPVAVVEPPKPDAPRPVGVQIKVDPKIAPIRHFDNPDDTISVPDLRTGDRVVLTGKVRVLQLGQVRDKGALDASGLIAEEVILGGDLTHEAQVQVNAPHGKVSVRGYVSGSTKFFATAPGGVVVVDSSGRISGSANLVVTAKRLDVICPLSGGAKVNATLTTGGSLKWKIAEEGATITYKPAAVNDPPLTIERGELRGSAKVVVSK